MVRLLAIALSSVLAAFTIYSPANPVYGAEAKGDEEYWTGGKPPADQVLRLALPGELLTVEPGFAEDSTSGGILRATFDGLTRVGPDGKAHEAVAQKIEVSDDLLTYTFHLREAKWSSGDPVKASDFEYAWKRVINPENRASLAFLMFPIKNAEKANRGEAKLDEVGVKALDEKTLQVTLEHPAPYFLELTSSYTYYPVDERVAAVNPNWAKEAATHVGNGPFQFKVWEHGKRIALIKNESYWDKNSVKLNGLHFTVIPNNDEELSYYASGELDWTGAPFTSISSGAAPYLNYAGLLNKKPIAGVYWYKFNTEQPPFQNVKIRKAFAYAVNRQLLLDRLGMHNVPALGVVPPTMGGNQEGYFTDYDPSVARKLLAEGMKELGITNLPPVTLSFNYSWEQQMIAEEAQRQWKETLGVDVILEQKEWPDHLEDLHNGNYQIGRMGWLADFNDPISFLLLFQDKDGGNNDTGWENPNYKELLQQSALEGNPEKRKQILARAEQILMDDMPVMPLYFYVRTWVQRDYVKGVVVDDLGAVDFKWAMIED